MERAKWASGLALAAGIWLIVAPFVLGYDLQAAVTNSIVSGVLIVAFAAAILFRRVHTWADWGLVLMGAWVMASPSMFGYSGQTIGAFNDLAVGMGVIVLAVAGMLLAMPRLKSYGRDYEATFVSAEPTDEERKRY